VCPELVAVASLATPDVSVVTDIPSVAEVRSAISRLRSGRAAGLGGITPGLFKSAIEPITNCLHSLFHRIFLSGRVPANWRDGVIIPLYKGNRSKTDCSRSISLLSVSGKVFAHWRLRRLKPLLNVHRRPQQSGFTPGRSTTDAILALRLFVELQLNFQRHLHVAYVDLKSAFNSVGRSSPWLALQGIGTPDIVLNLLHDLRPGTLVRVKVGMAISNRFPTTSRVCQVCIIAPALFCCAIY